MKNVSPFQISVISQVSFRLALIPLTLFLEIPKILENIMDLLISTTGSDTKFEMFYVLF